MDLSILLGNRRSKGVRTNTLNKHRRPPLAALFIPILALMLNLLLPNLAWADDTALVTAIDPVLLIYGCMGLFIACLLYSGFVALDSGEISHGYYALSCTLVIWNWGQYTDLFPVWPRLEPLPLLLLIASNGLFVVRFLYLSKNAPSMTKLIGLVSVIALVSIVILWLMPSIALTMVLVLLSLLILLTLVSSWIVLKKGMRAAGYCFAAYLLLGMSIGYAVMLPTGSQNGLSSIQSNILVLGCAVFLVLLSFALVERFLSIARRNLESSESLEQKVQNRTEQLQLANDRLEKLAQDLQAASEAKNTFLVNMSHEMRTPLTAIIGYADALVHGDIVTQEQPKAVAVIARNGEHLLHIINDLLDISKIENNTLEIEQQSLDPLALVQDIEQSVSSDVVNKQLKFSVIYRLPLPCEIVSDVTRVRQILLNIVSNAIKFTHSGEVELLVKVMNDRLIYSVSDTGIGMNQHQLDRIFQAFSQEDLSKSRQYGGTGLGLSIAKSLADKLGATIEVKSTQGQGSTFSLSLPFDVPNLAGWLRNDAELSQWLANLDYKHHQTNVVKQPKLNGKVLLAEDQLDNQELFVRMLERMGLSVTAVDNGYKAVQATLDEEFDLILMDIQMPEMDGLKAFELIQGTCSHVPIVALTANAMKTDVDLYKSLGFKEHIGKPVDRRHFIETISKYLNVSQSTDIGLDLDELAAIKKQFIERLVKRVDNIKTADAEQDWETIGKHAHAIKGSAGMFGFDALGALGAQLELSVKNDDLPACRTQLDDLLAKCQQIFAESEA